MPNGRRWDIHPDGDRFLMLQQPESRPQEQKLYVIQNSSKKSSDWCRRRRTRPIIGKSLHNVPVQFGRPLKTDRLLFIGRPLLCRYNERLMVF